MLETQIPFSEQFEEWRLEDHAPFPTRNATNKKELCFMVAMLRTWESEAFPKPYCIRMTSLNV